MKVSKLLNTTTKKIIAVVVLMLLIALVILFTARPELGLKILRPLMISILTVAILWVGIHFGMKAWRKRKREDFDEKVAAKEGVEDRKREWSTWTEELDKQGIDRYELPFYLLVGEPQSGKSVLLHNSDLHFPFGQNRLSGVGGTRGCDWWFTDEAVILDMAGRLFTHEGGAADRLEFEAFLKLLYDFRPLVPANGIILVIPCDSLLADSTEECAEKATKIQTALTMLTTQLQAQLPVYLVLTKGDQIFGFAETVHRLDVEQRHQMFGWSRPADRIEAPFDLTEVLQGFDGMVDRARLLRAHMMAGARLPEATPEIDRMTAFPHELEGLRPNLEEYLKRIFTASSITDRVLFRGVYLTSGLQSGVPIAKVSADLFGAPGEADMRDLEALFQKQRAYFIKDLVRNRVFGERGLVRPTEGRVQQAKKSAGIGYGIAGVILGLALIASTYYLLQETDTTAYSSAIEQAARLIDAEPKPDPEDEVREVLFALQSLAEAAQSEEVGMEQAFDGAHGEFEALYAELFDRRLLPPFKTLVLNGIRVGFQDGLRDYEDLDQKCGALEAIARGADFANADDREAMLVSVPLLSSSKRPESGGDPLDLRRAFELRDDYGDEDGMYLALTPREDEIVDQLLVSALREIEGCVQPSSRLRPRNELGYMLAWYGAEKAAKRLEVASQDGGAIRAARDFAATIADMRDIRTILPTGSGGREIAFRRVLAQTIRLNTTFRGGFYDLLRERNIASDFTELWSELTDVTQFVNDKMKEFDPGSPFSLSSLGLHFGSDDAGRTLFVLTEDKAAMAQGTITIEGDGGFDPVDTLDQPDGLVRLCEAALPLQLTAGSMKGLAEHLRRIKDEVLGSGSRVVLENIFRAECSELAQKFRDEVRTTPDVRRVFLGEETGEVSPLPGELIDELVGLHLMVARLLTEYDWGGGPQRNLLEMQVEIERHLNTVLTEAGETEAWMPPLTSTGELTLEAWDYLASLKGVTTLEQENPRNYKIKDAALTMMERGFVLRGAELHDRWRRREADDLDLTDETVEELRKLAVGVQENIGTDAMAGGDFQRWSRQVDLLLAERLGNVEGEIHALWRSKITVSASIDIAIADAEDELGQIGERINESEKEGMAAISDILVKLEPNGAIRSWLTLQRSEEVLEGLQDWSIPKIPAHVESHPEFSALDAALGALEGRTSDPKSLTRQYRLNWMDYKPEGGNVDAGVRLVREIRETMKLHVEQEIREMYLERLEDLFGEREYEELIDVLFWEFGDELADFDNASIEKSLDDLFNERRGDFTELLEEFELVGEDSISDKIFPVLSAEEREDEEDPWAAFHRFLLDLRDFLLAGDESERRRSIASSRIDFFIDSIPKTGSLWDLEGIAQSEKRNWFYYPAGGDTDDMKKEPLTAFREVDVRDWGFATEEDDFVFRLVWSDPGVWSDAQGDPDNAVVRVPTTLGPLILAWQGEPEYEDELTDFVVKCQPSGTKLKADLKIRFQAPIPLRPEVAP